MRPALTEHRQSIGTTGSATTQTFLPPQHLVTTRLYGFKVSDGALRLHTDLCYCWSVKVRCEYPNLTVCISSHGAVRRNTVCISSLGCIIVWDRPPRYPILHPGVRRLRTCPVWKRYQRSVLNITDASK